MNISEHQILIVSERVLEQCYLYNNMDVACKQQCVMVHITVISVLITVNHCNVFSPLNSYLYPHWILDFK